MTEPLQTHNRKVWAPPTGGRFIAYDKTDQAWMEPLGLGRYVLDSLYDVRDQLGELIGYTRQNPATCSRRMCELAFLETDHRPYFVGDNRSLDRLSIRNIRIVVGDFVSDDRRFACWQARLEDAFDLIVSPFIECTGADRLSDWIYELRVRMYRNNPLYRFGIDGRRTQ